MNQKMWIVRSNGGEQLPLFLNNKIVAIGWCSDKNLTSNTKEEIKRYLYEQYPYSEKSIPAWTGFLNNFVNEMRIDDYVLTYDSSLRIYYIGLIKSNYIYTTLFDEHYSHTRNVEWYQDTISRDLISTNTKNSLGSPQTIFQLNLEQKEEIIKLLNNKTPENEDYIIEENKEFSETLIENAKESLKDKIQQLSADEMEELIKEILNAMGYIAKRTPKGKDRGVDVFASKDGLGLEEPRIFAEVKHRKGQMGAQEIRSFKGGRQSGDKGLYISTGGFSQEARYEAERSNMPLTLIDINDLADLITLHYDKFTIEGKTLLPLKKVYLPL